VKALKVISVLCDRKNILLYAALTLLWLLSASSPESGTSRKPHVTVTVSLADQDGPLKLLGLRRPQGAGQEPYVHLLNASSVKTSHIWIEALARNSQGSIYRANSNAPNELWPAERMVPPGGDIWARETVIDSSSLLIAAKELDSDCINVTVLIMSVEFVDGTAWNPDLDKRLATLRESDHAREKGACDEHSTNKDIMSHVVGTVIRSAPQSSDADRLEEQKSYSYSCPLTLEKDKLVAVCPF